MAGETVRDETPVETCLAAVLPLHGHSHIIGGQDLAVDIV